MKFKAEAMISEQQLAEALEASGRPISLLQLSDWRKEGLLPPLANRGLGTGKGKSYYWNEVNIVAQAQCAYDLLARHGRHSVTILLLWICGYPVSLARVRRAWLQRSRRPRTWQLRNVRSIYQSIPQLESHSSAQNTADAALLKVVLTLCGSLTAGQRSEAEELYRILRNTSEALGFANESSNEVQYRLFTTLSLVISAIQSSSLLSIAGEEDMNAARNFTTDALRLVQLLASNKPEKGSQSALPQLAEVLGEPFFLCALLLQRTGYGEHLTKSSAAVQNLSASIIAGSSNRDRASKSFKSQMEKTWRMAPGVDNSQSSNFSHGGTISDAL